MASLPGPRTEPSASTSATTASNPSDAPAEPADARLAFRDALARYEPARLAALLRGAGLEPSRFAASMASDWTANLDAPREIGKVLGPIDRPGRIVLSLMAMTETTVWPVSGLAHALRCLGVDPMPAIQCLLDVGIIAIDGPAETASDAIASGRLDLAPPPGLIVRVHPAAPGAVRMTLPDGTLPAVENPAVQVRESDTLEPAIRLGALWQRLGAEPLRQTQQGILYKRDMERLESDPVLADDISDALESVPSLPMFWLALARRVGLVLEDAGDDRLVAAGAEFWAENAVHLPSMMATGWIGLRTWNEHEPAAESPSNGIPLVYLRPAILLWLATLDEGQWVALDDLAEHLRTLAPAWDRTSFAATAGLPAVPRSEAAPRRKGTGSARRSGRGNQALRTVLLGSGFAVGMVRAAEEMGTGRTLVQLTPLGRYVLTLGPPPPPRPTIEHFLFVQPNLEIIAYRQGLTPRLVGRLSQVAWWSRIAAALELKLTQESVIFGLESGLTAPRMVELLASHSQRALPSLVPDAIGRWASHRDRVTFYAAATLIEFPSREERDSAGRSWEGDRPEVFLPVGDRFLLAEDASRIPTDRIRTGGIRDYRLPPERCVSVEDDGVTLSLDASRSDLLVDAELRRIADELPASRTAGSGSVASALNRRYVVNPASLARAAAMGITPPQVADWFINRTGGPPSPAIGMLLRSAFPDQGPVELRAQRLLVLTTPTAAVADGLAQHPATRGLVGERLGPCALIVADDDLERLRVAAEGLGISLDSARRGESSEESRPRAES
ncbi:hypothetical protein [Aquisphaera insulae]|uniref:hypothetical protein n=1 Tax=Aquisphaera insulae TaxID=2712864 RepID=UPI0013EBEBC9|nr:hypothetical protein [Aquisphaera insulae]